MRARRGAPEALEAAGLRLSYLKAAPDHGRPEIAEVLERGGRRCFRVLATGPAARRLARLARAGRLGGDHPLLRAALHREDVHRADGPRG